MWAVDRQRLRQGRISPVQPECGAIPAMRQRSEKRVRRGCVGERSYWPHSPLLVADDRRPMLGENLRIAYSRRKSLRT